MSIEDEMCILLYTKEVYNSVFSYCFFIFINFSLKITIYWCFFEQFWRAAGGGAQRTLSCGSPSLQPPSITSQHNRHGGWEVGWVRWARVPPLFKRFCLERSTGLVWWLKSRTCGGRRRRGRSRAIGIFGFSGLGGCRAGEGRRVMGQAIKCDPRGGYFWMVRRRSLWQSSEQVFAAPPSSPESS